MIIADNRGTETGSLIYNRILVKRAEGALTPSATAEAVSNATVNTTESEGSPLNHLSTILVFTATGVLLVMVLIGWIIYQLKTRRRKLRERQERQYALARAYLQSHSNGRVLEISRPRPLQPPRGHAQCRRQSCCLKSPEMEKGAESSGSAGSSDTVASGTSGVNTVEDLATESPTSVTSASPSTPTDISFPTQETLPVFLGILINPQEDLERKEKALPPPPVEFKNPWFSTRFRLFSVPLATVEEEICEYDILPYLTGDRSMNSRPSSLGSRSVVKSTGERCSLSLASSSDHN